MAEAKITIGGRALSERQSEIVRIAIDRWSYDENIDVGSEDHDRVRELKAIITEARVPESQAELVS
jgi:hypothetical protein